MNKYLVLFICFIISLLVVTYNNDEDVIKAIDYEESIYVFNDISGDTSIVNNPDLKEINVYFYFVVLFYSLLFIVVTFSSMKKVKKYVNLNIN